MELESIAKPCEIEFKISSVYIAFTDTGRVTFKYKITHPPTLSDVHLERAREATIAVEDLPEAFYRELRSIGITAVREELQISI